MSEHLRSYSVARSYFSVISFLGWSVLIVGGLAFFAILANANTMPPEFGLPVALGLVFICATIGLSLIGVSQYWRAGVDAAEYTQQMLSVAREQLAVSQQGLGGNTAPPMSFGDSEVQVKPPEPSLDAPMPLEETEAKTSGDPNVIEYKGREISFNGKAYIFDGISFSSLKRAEAYINQLKVLK